MSTVREACPEGQSSEADRYRIIATRYRHGPAWRAKAALSFASRKDQTYQAFPDQQVRELVEVCRHELRDEQLPSVLADFGRVFSQAREIDRNARKKLEVDARILARLSTAEIAAELVISQSIIEAYESYFFDVRHQLNASTAIRCFAIPSAQEDLHRSYILAAAYSGGLAVAKFALERLDRLGVDHDLTTAAGRELEQLELDILSFSVDWYGRELTPQQAVYLHRGSRIQPTTPASISQFVANRLADRWAAISSSTDLQLSCSQATESAPRAMRDIA